MVLSAVYLLVIAFLINHVNIYNWCEHHSLCVCERAHKEIKKYKIKRQHTRNKLVSSGKMTGNYNIPPDQPVTFCSV